MQKSTKVNAPFYRATCKEMEGEVLSSRNGKKAGIQFLNTTLHLWLKEGPLSRKNFNGNTFFRKHCKKDLT